MFYFMSKGDFARIAVVVEVINGMSYLLPNDDAQKILYWVNNGMDTEFDQFCLAVSDEWCDSHPRVSLDDYKSIANIIHDCL